MAEIYLCGSLVCLEAAGEIPHARWQEKSISVARSRGDRCEPQMAKSLLDGHSWAIIEQTTCHKAEDLPAVAAILEQLIQMPEWLQFY